MSYKIAKSGSVRRGLKRAAAGEIERAQKALARKRIHEARKRFKKVRGLLRLARRGLGRKRFKRENALFRYAGQEIRAPRDAEALVETLDALASRYFKRQTPPAIFIRLRRLLVRQVKDLERGVASNGAFARTSRSMREELCRVGGWKLGHFTWKDARRAWRQAREQFREAFEAAREAPTDANLHAWRKRAKTLWYQTLLLRKGCPKVRKHMEDIEAVEVLLGEDRDLALLAKAVSDRERALRSADQLKILLGLLAERRKKLQAKALALAAIFCGGPTKKS